MAVRHTQPRRPLIAVVARQTDVEHRGLGLRTAPRSQAHGERHRPPLTTCMHESAPHATCRRHPRCRRRSEFAAPVRESAWSGVPQVQSRLRTARAGKRHDATFCRLGNPAIRHDPARANVQARATKSRAESSARGPARTEAWAPVPADAQPSSSQTMTLRIAPRMMPSASDARRAACTWQALVSRFEHLHDDRYCRMDDQSSRRRQRRGDRTVLDNQGPRRAHRAIDGVTQLEPAFGQLRPFSAGEARDIEPQK